MADRRQVRAQADSARLIKKWEREIGSQVGIADLEFQIMNRFDRTASHITSLWNIYRIVE
jgi:hypothetical protein